MALLWGYNWVVMKIAMRYSGPLDFAALRGGFGVLVLFGALVALRVPLKPRHVGKTIWLGLFQTTGFVGLISWSLTSGPRARARCSHTRCRSGCSRSAGRSSRSGCAAGSGPPWGSRSWASCSCSRSGTARRRSTSSLLALAAGASWGVSVIIFKKIPVESRDDLLSLTAWQMLYGIVPLVVAALLVPERPIEWTGAFIAALAVQHLRRNGDRDAAVALHPAAPPRDDQQPELARRADRRRARGLDPARRAAERRGGRGHALDPRRRSGS